MWLNCVFGGKGVGLVNLLLYLIVGVFLAGLMVGRTPEYLGKKVEAREMVLYEFSSASANNGSGFEGLQDTWGFNQVDEKSPPAPYSPHWDIATGLVMLLSRFLPIIAPIALAGSLAVKKPTPFTAGTAFDGNSLIQSPCPQWAF